jgi:hypothetical protein
MMKVINVENEKIKSILSQIERYYLSDNVSKLVDDWEMKRLEDSLITSYHPCSDKYLFEAHKLDVLQFCHPRAVLGISIKDMAYFNLRELVMIETKLLSLGKIISSTKNSLSIIYPENGYIGWHHNGNAPGYNALFTYSVDGSGNFKYWDRETKSITTIQDNPGWNIKVGYFPSIEDENKLFWHAAETKSKRISIAYILDNEEAWKKATDRILSKE